MFERLYNFFFTPAPKVEEGPWIFEDLENEYQTCKCTAPNGNVVYIRYFTKEQVRRLQAPPPKDRI